jgi:hypothetical protein
MVGIFGRKKELLLIKQFKVVSVERAMGVEPTS